jgi:hypothetical protein
MPMVDDLVEENATVDNIQRVVLHVKDVESVDNDQEDESAFFEPKDKVFDDFSPDLYSPLFLDTEEHVKNGIVRIIGRKHS